MTAAFVRTGFLNFASTAGVAHSTETFRVVASAMAVAVLATQNAVTATVSAPSNIAKAVAMLALTMAAAFSSVGSLGTLQFCFTKGAFEANFTNAFSTEAFSIAVAVAFTFCLDIACLAR
jgi:hypothetical protein